MNELHDVSCMTLPRTSSCDDVGSLRKCCHCAFLIIGRSLSYVLLPPGK